MSAIRPCPRCGGTDIKRAHRQRARERFASLLGFYPFSCRGCRHRFLRHASGAAFLLAMVMVWLVAAALVGGVTGWLLRERPPTAGRAAVPDQAAQPNQQLRQSLAELRLNLAKLAAQKADLQRDLAELGQNLATRGQAAGVRPPEDPRIALLEGKNQEMRRTVDDLARDKAALRTEVARLSRHLEQAPSPPRPAAGAPVPTGRNPSTLPEYRHKVLLATVPFAPGRTQTSDETRPLLEQVVRQLQQRPRALVLVEGNADSTPLGPATAKIYYDNAGVALARALAVFRALRAAGVDPARMRVTAAGAPTQGPEAGRTVSIWLVDEAG